eukprot:g29083.t1
MYCNGTEEEVKETYTSETRWIVEPQSELRLLVHFTSTEVATHYANLTFEVVDAVGSGPVYIGVSGVAALPGIATEPRQIFPRFKKRRPEDGYAVKAFVTSLGLYDFGPLLAGRTPSSRIPVVEEPEDDQGGEEGASISLDREEVDFGRLMMNIRAEDQKAAEEAAEGETGEQAGPAVPEEIGVEPKEGQLAPHEEPEGSIRAFGPLGRCVSNKTLQLEARDAEGLNEWQKAANISVSAESFAVDAVIEPDPREVPLDFGTVLVHTSAQRIFEIVNRGRFPVRYELAIRRALRELLQIDQPKDELQPGERRAITVTCTPGRVFEASSDGIALQIFDQLSGESVDHRIPPMRVALTAVYNTFQVTPPRGLNFGPVEKGETQTRTFTVRSLFAAGGAYWSGACESGRCLVHSMGWMLEELGACAFARAFGLALCLAHGLPFACDFALALAHPLALAWALDALALALGLGLAFAQALEALPFPDPALVLGLYASTSIIDLFLFSRSLLSISSRSSWIFSGKFSSVIEFGVSTSVRLVGSESPDSGVSMTASVSFPSDSSPSFVACGPASFLAE